MKHLAAFAASALALGATGALAGSYSPPPVDPIPTPVPIIETFSWSGGYVGLHLGVATGNNRWDERSVSASSTPGDWGGTPWGVRLGYDMQSGAWVFGAALDYTHGVEATSETSATFACGATGCVTTVDNTVALRARVGYAWDRTLFYATAGAARGEVMASSSINPNHGSGSLNGWVAGVGLEHAVNNRWSVGVEYLHTDLGRLEIPVACNTDCFTDVSFGTLRLGVNFRF